MKDKLLNNVISINNCFYFFLKSVDGVNKLLNLLFISHIDYE